MSAALLLAAALLALACAAGLVGGARSPHSAARCLLGVQLAVACVCGAVGASWIAVLLLAVPGLGAAGVLALTARGLPQAGPAPATAAFPLLRILGAGVVLAALLGLAAPLARLALPAAPAPEGFGSARELALRLFSGHVLVAEAVALLLLVALLAASTLRRVRR